MRERQINDERRLAVFIDFENIALGVREAKYKSFEISLVLARVVEKGKIMVKRAYADWEKYTEYKRAFHSAAVEMIEIPRRSYSGKNSADIRMAVDAMDLSYSKEHIDTFVIASGDSDFSPLVSKLRENNKFVIGLGVKNSSSELLVANCDEFIYYDDLVRGIKKPRMEKLSDKKSEVFELLVDSILALLRENKDILWASMVKQTMMRKRPDFTESYFGYSTFSKLLEDASKHKIVDLKRDDRSRTYIIMGLGEGH